MALSSMLACQIGLLGRSFSFHFDVLAFFQGSYQGSDMCMHVCDMQYTCLAYIYTQGALGPALPVIS